MIKYLVLPISAIYSFIQRIRNFFYDKKWLKINFFNSPYIITIGNLAVGGTGKTPFTDFIVKKLKEKNYKTAILSRGYKRKSKGFHYIDSQTDITIAGDEPLLLAKKNPNTIVAVCKKREVGIKKIKKEKNPDFIILDDAFQYRKISPHLNILLTSYHKPYFNDLFLPTGTLRDNRVEAHRADIIIITKSPENIKPIEKSIWRTKTNLKPYQSLFFSSLKYTSPYNILNNEKILNIEKQNVLLISGIADTMPLTNYLLDKGVKYKHLKYSDHKNYKIKDINKIKQNFDKIKTPKIILTTAKDAEKLKKILPDELLQNTYVQDIEIKILFNQENELLENIVKKKQIYF